MDALGGVFSSGNRMVNGTSSPSQDIRPSILEILLRGKPIDVEIQEIPAREMAEIMKIQNAKPASLVRYSLFPRKMLRIQPL